MSDILSTVIISVYRDVRALELILDSLAKQTSTSFEVIISEDGCCEEMRDFVATCHHPFPVSHLAQADNGFRKNIALNRAVIHAHTNHLIFIDGDCVLHPGFVQAHQRYRSPGIAATGRRLEVGEHISQSLRDGSIALSYLTSATGYLLHAPALHRDHAKNLESGIYSELLHRLTSKREIRLLGCNFSCHRSDLERVNGFDERYRSPGIGEDSDIDLRLTRAGVVIRNVKFSAIQYHLYHPRRYQVSEENKSLYQQAERSDSFVCEHGMYQQGPEQSKKKPANVQQEH